MVRTVEDMEKCTCQDCNIGHNLVKLTGGMDKLNGIFNDVHHKVMEIHAEAGDIGVTCTTTLSSHSHLKKFDALEQQYRRLEVQNTTLKN